MKKALIISYNLIREGETSTPLSIASIIANLEKEPEYGKAFDVEHLPINLLDNFIKPDDFERSFKSINLNNYRFICISAFIWNEYLINPLIKYLRNNGYINKIVLGGSQITYAEKERLNSEYPECNVFISGYAESAMLEILKAEKSTNSFYSSSLDFGKLVSPYLSGTLSIPENQKMIRWETKRGCPYSCSFCAHRNLENGRVNYMHTEKVFAELAMFKEKNVGRINVLDPVFNISSSSLSYLDVMKEIDRLSFNQTTFTLQSKIELLAKKDGTAFLDFVEKTNSHLEFGIQTIIPQEYEVVTRNNDIRLIAEQLDLLNKRGISYEVSLIYGLPNQTVDSFRKSVDILMKFGCKAITAWPLMLLKGTPLYAQRDRWNFKEEIIGDFNIPIVTSSTSFNKDDWFVMQQMAESLIRNNRY